MKWRSDFFFDEKIFDLDEVYNSQNASEWAANRQEAHMTLLSRSYFIEQSYS
jgi:hypothetical protein